MLADYLPELNLKVINIQYALGIRKFKNTVNNNLSVNMLNSFHTKIQWNSIQNITNC